MPTRFCFRVWPIRCEGVRVLVGKRYVGSLLIALVYHAAELPHSFKILDRRRYTPKSAQNRSESLCAALWVLPDIWPSFRPKSGSKSNIPDRILKSVRGPFNSAETTPLGPIQTLPLGPASESGRAAGSEYLPEATAEQAGVQHTYDCVINPFRFLGFCFGLW